MLIAITLGHRSLLQDSLMKKKSEEDKALEEEGESIGSVATIMVEKVYLRLIKDKNHKRQKKFLRTLFKTCKKNPELERCPDASVFDFIDEMTDLH